MRRTKDFSCYCIKLLQRPRQHPAFWPTAQSLKTTVSCRLLQQLRYATFYIKLCCDLSIVVSEGYKLHTTNVLKSSRTSPGKFFATEPKHQCNKLAGKCRLVTFALFGVIYIYPFDIPKLLTEINEISK